MPRFLEKKLKKEYGEDSDVPYKIMNKLGFMRGSKVTSKGEEAESKHKGVPGERTKEKEVKQVKKEVIRPDEKLTGLDSPFKKRISEKLLKRMKS